MSRPTARHESAPRALPSLIATDLDGTLLHSDGTVSDRTRAAVRAATDAGALLIAVTGRPPRWLGPIVDAFQGRGRVVCANGALIYDLGTEQVTRTAGIEPDDAATVIRLLRERLPDVTFGVERADGFGHEPSYARPDLNNRLAASFRPEVAPLEELLTAPVTKLLLRHPDAEVEDLAETARETVGQAATVTYSGGHVVEISAAGITKASALRHLAHEAGLDADDALAFGDMPNDLPMLTWAGHAIAVANAHPDVLELADEVTDSNDDDGVAIVLERLIEEA
ncbi:MAG: HAD family hydrolase [Egibacteraceae bacterium]